MPFDDGVNPARLGSALIATAAIALSYCAWIGSLPLFPTQDGPMHLYFTHVLREVLQQPVGFYGHFYSLRHILPPYSLYYYALMGLGSLMPLVMADKVIVCSYVVSFCFGFRYLARAIGPAGDLVAPLATVLVLSWPVGMGFLNFSLSTTFAFWALGLWCRFADQPGTGLARRVAFVGLCAVMMLTHPVPLLLLAGFCGVHLLLMAWRTRALPLRDVATWLLGLLTLGYILLFSNGHMLRQVHGPARLGIHEKWTLLKGYLLLHNLLVFAGRGPLDFLLRGMIYLLLAGGLLFAALRWWQDRQAGSHTLQATLRHAATAFALLMLVGFPLLPEDLNGSAYFAARLLLYVWLTALVAASGAKLPKAWARVSLQAAALAGTALILLLAHRRLDPVARELAEVEQARGVPKHAVALLLHAPGYTLDHSLTYDPFFWNGVRALRQTDSVMYNTPWLDLPILPLGARAPLPTGWLGPNDLESPPRLRTLMESSGAVRESVFSQVNVVLVSFGNGEAGTIEDELLRGRGWSCRPERLLEVCVRPDLAAAGGGSLRKKPPLVALR